MLTHIRVRAFEAPDNVAPFCRFGPGADPHKENYEPLFFRDEESCREDKDEVDEGYIPGTSPLNMAASSEVSHETFLFFVFFLLKFSTDSLRPLDGRGYVMDHTNKKQSNMNA